MFSSRKQRHRRQRKPQPVALPAILNDDQILTLRQWCALNNIGYRTGRRILKARGGPIVTNLSANKIGISVKNNRRWQESRERA